MIVLGLLGICLLLILVVLGLLLRRSASTGGSHVGSRVCARCSQRVPDIGRFCPLCGQPVE